MNIKQRLIEKIKEYTGDPNIEQSLNDNDFRFGVFINNENIFRIIPTAPYKNIDISYLLAKVWFEGYPVYETAIHGTDYTTDTLIAVQPYTSIRCQLIDYQNKFCDVIIPSESIPDFFKATYLSDIKLKNGDIISKSDIKFEVNMTGPNYDIPIEFTLDNIPYNELGPITIYYRYKNQNEIIKKEIENNDIIVSDKKLEFIIEYNKEFNYKDSDTPINTEYSHYMHYDVHLVEMSLLLANEPIFITDMSARYISNKEIAVDDPVPREYVEIYIKKSDNTTERFTIENRNDFQIINVDEEKIYHVGDNVYDISYHEIVKDDNGIIIKETDWISQFTIIGKIKELEIYGEYLGQTRILGNLVPNSEIQIYLVYYDGYETKTRLLNYTEWSFKDRSQKITEENLGIFTIYRFYYDDQENHSLSCRIEVPFAWSDNIGFGLEVWYEGPPVLIGNPFNPDDFRIYLHNPDGTTERISFNDCSITPYDYKITKEWYRNWYTVSYKTKFKNGNVTVTDKIAIWGIAEKEYVTGTFKVLYYDEEDKCLKDLTSSFELATTVAGRRFINWERMAKRIAEIGKFGYYILQAPAKSGLNSRFPTIWEIECNKVHFLKKNKNLMAKLSKIIYEYEEEE